MKGKVRVAHIITMLELGGAQQNTLYTVEHLDRRRFSVSLIAGGGGILSDPAGSIPDLQTFILSSLVRPIRPFRDLAALLRLWILLRRVRPHVVHTHSSKAGILGRWAAFFAGTPVIIHSIHGFGFHDYQASRVRRFFIGLEKLTARITTKFVAVSRANIEKGCREGIFQPGDATLIRSGIPIEAFTAADTEPAGRKSAAGLDPDVPVVGMIACFKPQKAPLDFVDLAGIVLEKVPRAKFLMAGDGELREGIEARIREKGLEGSVILLGWREDIPALLRAFDVLVLPSLWEGLPRVFPQAMAAGVPIVATNVDGAAEAVEHGVTGYLADPHDVRAMADSVIRLLCDPELAVRMGRKGSERVGEFDIRKMVRQQEELYLRLVNL